MVPRESLVWLPRTATPAEAEALSVASGHTRLLVAGEGVDDVLGFVHAKDLLTIPAEARDRPIPLRLVRRMIVVAPGPSSTTPSWPCSGPASTWLWSWTTRAAPSAS